MGNGVTTWFERIPESKMQNKQARGRSTALGYAGASGPFHVPGKTRGTENVSGAGDCSLRFFIYMKRLQAVGISCPACRNVTSCTT